LEKDTLDVRDETLVLTRTSERKCKKSDIRIKHKL